MAGWGRGPLTDPGSAGTPPAQDESRHHQTADAERPLAQYKRRFDDRVAGPRDAVRDQPVAARTHGVVAGRVDALVRRQFMAVRRDHHRAAPGGARCLGLALGPDDLFRLEQQGELIGSYDLLIAAQVLRRDALFVTNNTREFSRVPGLKLEDWTKP